MENLKHKHREGITVGYRDKQLTTIDSREVAEMLGKGHAELLRDIDGRDNYVGIIPTLEKANLALSNYFIPSTYKAGTREYKCYLVTKMGCELLGNKQQGEKGILFTAKYVERFNQMEQAVSEQVKPLTTEEMLELQFKYTKEVKAEVKELRDDFTEYKETTPLFTVECKELQALVRKKGVEVLGGKGSQAYIDNSLRGKVYADIQHQLKREFQVTKYEAIKRGQFVTAKEIVENYRVPTGLKEEIIKVNNQIDFKNAI